MIQQVQNQSHSNSNTQVLTSLGLTPLEATIYLTLVKLGEATTQRIANASSIARSEVYRVMPTLLELGLAVKFVNKTTFYEATPLKEGLLGLLQKKNRECTRLEKEVNCFLTSFNEDRICCIQEKSQQFKVISEFGLLMRMHKKLIGSASASIDMTDRGAFFQDTIDEHLPFFEEAKRKGVKIRVIVDTTDGKNPPIRTQALARKLFTNVRYTDSQDLFGLHIFDEKDVTMGISGKEGLPSLWSNDPNIVKLAKTWFEEKWYITK